MMSDQIKRTNLRRFRFLPFLVFLAFTQACGIARRETSIAEMPSPIPPTSTVEQPIPIPPAPTFEAPSGFMEYRDEISGVRVYVPEDWYITGIIEGDYAIIQSYPPDKYVGGEPRQPGDTKCDLNLGLDADSPEDLLQRWASNSRTTILSQQQIKLASGLPGQRVELDNMGLSHSMITEINDRVIVLTCFGEFEYFDEMASTIIRIE